MRRLSKCIWILLGVKVWGRVNNTVWLYVLAFKKKSKRNGGRGKLLMPIMYTLLWKTVYIIPKSLQQCCWKGYIIISIPNWGSKVWSNLENVHIVILTLCMKKWRLEKNRVISRKTYSELVWEFEPRVALIWKFDLRSRWQHR